MAGRIAIVGSGLVGRAWATVFARAGFAVAVFDPVEGAAAAAIARIEASLPALAEADLLAGGTPAAVLGALLISWLSGIGDGWLWVIIDRSRCTARETVTGECHWLICRDSDRSMPSSCSVRKAEASTSAPMLCDTTERSPVPGSARSSRRKAASCRPATRASRWSLR